MSDGDGGKHSTFERLVGFFVTMAAVGALAFSVQAFYSIGNQRSAYQQGPQDADCEDAHDCERKSLKADIRAANAADDAIDLGVGQFWFNLIGLVGLGATVIYARGAWIEARKSAVAAHEALKDSRDSAEEQLQRFVLQLNATRESAQAMGRAASAMSRVAIASAAQAELSKTAFETEFRPWVGLMSESLDGLAVREDGQTRVEINLDLFNSGRTPAHRVCIQARLIADPQPKATVRDIEGRFNAQPRDIGGDYITTLLPSQGHKLSFGIEGDLGDVNRFPLENGERVLLFTVAGFITYRSQVGDPGEHVTTFIYRLALQKNRYIRWRGSTLLFTESELQVRRWPDGWLAD